MGASEWRFPFLCDGIRNNTSVSISSGSSTKIGSRTLASYSYSTDGNHYLTSLDYGNGDSVDYSYDKYGNVMKETYEDSETVSYAYDNNGDLAMVTDSATGRKNTYYYDTTGRLMKYEEKGSGIRLDIEDMYTNMIRGCTIWRAGIIIQRSGGS